MLLNKDTFIRDYKNKIVTMFRERLEEASLEEKYLALGSLIRDYMAPDWLYTEMKDSDEKRKHIYYFSMEFLIGRLLDSALINLGIRDLVREGLEELGIELPVLEEEEPDAGLGNGGLGRLAACFIDSMASLDIAGTGIGIRYRYGLFRQLIENGYQVETPDNWLKIPNVWEIRKAEDARIVKFGGNVNMNWGLDGRLYVELTDYEPVLAVPYDIPVPGYSSNRVNTLRLWSAETENSGFDFREFSKGDYDKAVENIITAHSISNVLYPDDSTPRGKLLRLKQEYFFTSAGLQDILGRYLKGGGDIREFHRYNAVQINDTHPALAIPGEVVNMMGQTIDMALELSALCPKETMHYLGECVEIALGAMKASRLYIIDMADQCSDDTFRYINRRENEITLKQYGETAAQVLAAVEAAI